MNKKEFLNKKSGYYKTEFVAVSDLIDSVCTAKWNENLPSPRCSSKPVEVAYVNKGFSVTDGYHRIAEAKRRKVGELLAVIYVPVWKYHH